MTPTDCPLCQSPASMLESLSDGRQFCNGCGQVFKVDAEGTVVLRQQTQHSRRITDVSGHVMDGD